MTAGVSRSRSDDEGVTLVELIIYVLIAGILLTLLASLFITGMRVDAATRERDVATGRAQVVSSSILTSVRNASDLTATSSELRARVAAAGGWQCRAWLLDGDELRYASYAPGSSAPDTADWNVLAEGVAGTLGSGPFTVSGDRLVLGIAVTVGDSTVPLSGAAVARAREEGIPTPCW